MKYLGYIDGIGTKLDSGRKLGDQHAGLVIHTFTLRVFVTKRKIANF